MSKASNIKSKKRVRDYGEVYTPSHIVKDMCNLVPIIDDIHTTVLEPAFGNGNFLVEIYERKLKNCKTGEDIVDVVKSVYGIELLEDNVKEAKERLWKLIKDTGIKLSDSNVRQIIIVMNLNLQQGDSLTQIKSNGNKIQFIDWRDRVTLKGAKLKEQTLAHYGRMIKWVEKQDPDDMPCLLKMLDEIKENWQGDYCPLCNTFFRCFYCPIAKAGYECCFESPWTKLAKAKTWKEWLEGAKEEVAFIESLEF